MSVYNAINGLVTAAERAAIGFSRSFGAPPTQIARTEWSRRQARFLLLWGLWDGTAYDTMAEWARYKEDNGLVSDIRLFESHVHRVADFYFAHVYSGELAEDGLPLPGGIPNAIPLATDTDPKLTTAIGQLWRWWGFVDMAPLAVLYSVVVGNVAIELYEDMPGMKIRANLVWPGYVTDIKLSEAGDVIYFAKEYDVFDQAANNGNGELYRYRYEIDKVSIRTYKNREPHSYDGFGSVRPNPYGFVPVVWYRGVNTGGPWGEPVIVGSQPALDIINSLYTSMYGNLRMIMDAPIFVAGRTRPGSVAEQMRSANEAIAEEDTLLASTGLEYGRSSDSNLRIVQVGPESQLLAAKVDVGQVRLAIRDLISGMEAQFPEIKFWNEIRKMPALTKPGVESAMGDVIARLRRFSGSCDRQTKKLHQMGVAMAGMRFNDGSWAKVAAANNTPMTEEQQKFESFSLNSYAEGTLNHTILPRDLVRETEENRLSIAQQMIDMGIPSRVAWKRAGFTDEDIAEWMRSGEAITSVDVANPANSNRLSDILGNIGTQPEPEAPTNQ